MAFARCRVTAFLLVLMIAASMSAQVSSPGPPPELAERYQTRNELIGYPPLAPVRTTRRADKDWLPALRMTWFRHGQPMSPEFARRVARDLADLGFNVIISEDARYLLREPGEPVGADEEATGAMPFPDLVANTRQFADACHAEGLRFIGHLTCDQVARASYARRHPEQAMIDIRTGQTIVRHGTGIAYMCHVNDAFWKHWLARAAEFIEKTNLDGLMVDEIQTFYETPYGCACASCRAALKAETGIALPPNGQPGNWFHPDNPDYLRWLRWKNEWTVRRQIEIRQVLRQKRGPHATMWTYSTNPAYPDSYRICSLLPERFADYADAIGIEVEPPGGRPYLYTYYWRNIVVDFKIQQADAAHASGVTYGLFYSSFPHDYVWNTLLSFALGLKQWWTMSDPNAKPSWQPMLAWETRHEALLANHQPLGNIAVVYSANTQNHQPHIAGRHDYAFAFANVCKALLDSHLPFRILLDRDLDAGRLAGLDAIFLPSVLMMSDRAVANLRQFAAKGGTILATGEQARYDENGKPRAPGEWRAVNAVALAGRPDLKYASQFLAYGAPLVRPGQPWEDKRDPAARAEIADAVRSRITPVVRFENVPLGVFAEARTQRFAGAHNTVVSLANFTGAELQTGIVPLHLDPVFPPVAFGVPPSGGIPATPPEGGTPNGKPLIIRARVPKPRAVYLVSPDNEHAAKLSYRQDGADIVVELPRLDRLALIYFVHGRRELVRDFVGEPVPVKMVTRAIPPLVGPYDPEATVAFVGHDQTFAGGQDYGRFKNEPCRIAYGARSKNPQIKATLTLKTLPAKAELTVGGMDDNALTKAPIELLVNGVTVFRGASQFPDEAWAARSFPIPDGALQAGPNEVVLRNIGDSSLDTNPPWFAVTFFKIGSNSKGKE